MTVIASCVLRSSSGLAASFSLLLIDCLSCLSTRSDLISFYTFIELCVVVLLRISFKYVG